MHRARHAKPSRLRKITVTAGLSTAIALPLAGFTAAPAAAHPTRAAAASPASSAAQPTLRLGSRNTAVVRLQQRLGGLRADGAFGPMTKRAVVAFQARRGLTADGVVGRRTWAALGAGAAAAPRPAAAPRASRGGQRSVGSAAVAEASRHAGKPYRYGATGPSSFDCSGFVQYVFGRVGVSLPRTSRQQAASARPVARGSERLGDLIIFRSGGTVTHVGIYAGSGTMWVARRSGTTVTRQTIYTGSYTVGRVA